MNAIASHRPYSWAREWHKLGHEIHVLTPVKHGFDGAMDLQRDLSGIHIHQITYLPLRESQPGALSTGRSTQVKRWEWIKIITRRVRFGFAMFGDARLLAYFPMVRKGLQLVRSRRIDLIIATSPPEVTFFVGRTLSRRTGVPWVADFRDLWFRDMRIFQFRSASWLSGLVHRWLVRNATALVTVSRGLERRLSGYLGRPVIVSYNGFFEDERNEPEPLRPWADRKRHIVYTGRLFRKKRDPEPLFRAIARLRSTIPDLTTVLAVDFYGFDDPWLQSLVARHGVEELVTLHGFVPYRHSVSAQRSADMLLFLDWTDTQAEGVLTGKLFEYLGSGRPILSIGRIKDTEVAALITRAECGVTLTTDEEIEEYVRVFLAASKRPAAVGSPSRDEFSREHQAAALIKELQPLALRPTEPIRGPS